MRNVVVRVCLGFLAAAILVHGQPGTSRGRDHYCRPPSDSLSMCLANLGSGTPFLSLLELRHIDNHLAYQDANQSAALLFYSRCNLGSLANDTLSNFAFVTMRSSVNSTLFVSFIEIIAPSIQDALAIPETHRFTYDELKAITNNFDLVLGKGGFGNVYHGRLHDGTEAAVKLCTHIGWLFSYHRNLVSLIGYCRDSNQLGLVYEYAACGSLRDHLSDKTGNSQTLSWRERIRIAVEAAQVNEFMNRSIYTRDSVPPIIHRDVKTNNILLTHDFEAKVADFGLSKPFPTDISLRYKFNSNTNM
ncbi:receptor-like serine threonine-protein kinase [Musa troglodytarum]|uniref:Receptor-like serine threonine-protein kinase n=1 Tax=Musa troglodytarum TaxID=320322 RepID=A0A9E7I1K1_9LILI|nr:receptor-like serine threonine-protein kinase [Musa troglodytarum]